MSGGSLAGTPGTKASVRSPWFLSLLFSTTTLVATVFYFQAHSVAWHRSGPPVPGAGRSLEGYLTLVRMIAAVLALIFGLWAVRRGDHKLMAWLSLGFAILTLLVSMIVLM